MRAVITHFDGDPFLLNAWLMLYEKYWRGECDKVYMVVCNRTDFVPKEVTDFNIRLVAQYPEIVCEFVDQWELPESANQRLLQRVTEDQIGFIESDGFVFGRGIVDQCFRLLTEGQDVVSAPWELIRDPFINGDLHFKGFMRCFFFTKKQVLDRINVDFFPRTALAGVRILETYTPAADIPLDCFGWISLQIALLTQKITFTNGHVMTPDNILTPWDNWKWVHVRQMQSSALGMGGGSFKNWITKDRQHVLDNVFDIVNENLPGGPNEFTFVKAVAFRLIFIDMFLRIHAFDLIGQFAADYRQVLESVIDLYTLPRERIYEIKGYYKALFQL